MKEWFASTGRKWHLRFFVWVAISALVGLSDRANIPGPVSAVAAQPENVEGGGNQTPDARHSLSPSDLAKQMEELLREKTIPTPVEQKIDSKIRAITGHMGRRMAEARSGETPTFSDLSTDLLKINDQGEVQVYVILKDFTREEVAQLEGLGLRVELTLPEQRLIQGWVGNDALDAIAALDVVERVTPPDYARHNSGAVNSQGDSVLRADVARSTFGANGSGVKVCVVSDGVNHLASSVTSGDLPTSPPVQVLNNPGGDEGTAMLEIIHDLAPGAALAFYGVTTSAEFLLGLNALQGAGCRVIVDDIFFRGQEKFEDGMVAQKVRQLATSGIVYVTAAGNDGQGHYFANYRRLPGQSFPTPSHPAVHNFSVASLDIGDTFVIPPNGAINVVLQWSDKFGTSGNDFDLILARSDNFSILSFSNNVQNGGGDPIEALSYTNATGSPITAFISIAESHLISDPSTIKLNYIVFPINLPTGSPVREYVVPADSIFGHAAVNEALSVAAVNVANPTVIESFSSRGPATILFPTPETRSVPKITGVDGVQTHVGQLGIFPPPSGGPFFGTSAAAPHVAAIAALLWSFKPSLTSSQVVQTLTQTAVDLGAPGFDTTFGFGRVDAVLALSNSVASRLTNLSTRAQVGLGAAQVIAGVTIGGTTAKTVLIRALGPTLGLPPFNVPGALPNPVVTLFSGQTAIAQNDNWMVLNPLCASPAQTCGGPAAIAATGLAPPRDTEAAVHVTLLPGAYTAIVSGAGATRTGVGLVEVYEVP